VEARDRNLIIGVTEAAAANPVVPTGTPVKRQIANCRFESRVEARTMKTLLLIVTVTATALMLAATRVAVGEAKNQSPFTRSLKVVRTHTHVSPIERLGPHCCL
jgi:hypothetical protein